VYYHAGGKRGSRPVLTGADAKDTFESIPVINVEGMFSDSLEERKNVAAAVGKASREVGFFYAQNHSVTEDTVTKTFEAIELHGFSLRRRRRWQLSDFETTIRVLVQISIKRTSLLRLGQTTEYVLYLI
jgi:isopenicillin N synthase-like dioxygenase